MSSRPPPPPPPPKGAPPKPKKNKPVPARVEENAGQSEIAHNQKDDVDGTNESKQIGPTSVPIMVAIRKVMEENNDNRSDNVIRPRGSISTQPRKPPSPTLNNGGSNPFDDTSGSTTPPTSTPIQSRHIKLSISSPGDIEQDQSERSSESQSAKTRDLDILHSVGEPNNPLYHKIRLSETWLVASIVIFCIQFLLLLVVASGSSKNVPPALPPAALGVLLLIIVSVVGLLVYARYLVSKSRLSTTRNIRLRGGACSPDDEADNVPDTAVYLIALAALLEGVAFAIYTTVTAGNTQALSNSGFYSQGTTVQTLRFVSITLLALHRILRPANRIDPMRTILELEVVSVCWDALDGSTLYELIDGNSSLPPSYSVAVRVLMGFWYLSVGIRMAIMFMTHLSPWNAGNRLLLTAPLELAPQPTVDRTFQSLRLRSLVVMAMTAAEFYAAVLRVILWSQDRLDLLQQEMALKNFLFLLSMSGAYDMYSSTIHRNWNSRDIFLCIKYPLRSTQLQLCRWFFVVSYLLIAGLLSAILVVASPGSIRWFANLIIDIVLCVIFIFYCGDANNHEQFYNPPNNWFSPRKGFIIFPASLVITISVLMGMSLYIARIPALYYAYPQLLVSGSSLATYDNAILILILSVVPVWLLASYWSISYMLFRKEFTACPGNYNGIHDPTISMVALYTMTEGALDVISTATLMELAESSLPAAVNGAVVLFCLLEMVNACQCFALQCLLSGGHDDTPLDLVRWKALLRAVRIVIDSGTLILRLILWIQYDAVSSVFLVKNLYNLMHSSAQIERYLGVKHYPKDTLFSEFVPPADWYGMSKEQWRQATCDTLAMQARAGRRV